MLLSKITDLIKVQKYNPENLPKTHVKSVEALHDGRNEEWRESVYVCVCVVCVCVCVNKALKDITYIECLMECFYFVFKMLLMEKGQQL